MTRRRRGAAERPTGTGSSIEYPYREVNAPTGKRWPTGRRVIKVRHCSSALCHTLLSTSRFPPCFAPPPSPVDGDPLNDRNTISALLADDPSLSLSRATGGESLVLLACYMGAPELAELLYPGRPTDAGADAHALSNDESTPAMRACARGFPDLGTKLAAVDTEAVE